MQILQDASEKTVLSSPLFSAERNPSLESSLGSALPHYSTSMFEESKVLPIVGRILEPTQPSPSNFGSEYSCFESMVTSCKLPSLFNFLGQN